MRPFLGTFENKVDRKGRVSVPASFRQILAQTSYQGVVAFSSYKEEAIEGCSMDFMEKLADSLGDIDLFSETQEDLSATIFSESYQLPFDGEGRILLPADLCEQAGITDRAAFMGMGQTFRIWQPERLAAFKASSRARAKEKGLTLKLRRPEGEA